MVASAEEPAAIEAMRVAEVTAPQPPLEIAEPSRLMVAREAELAALHERLALALQGKRQAVFITGEAGIGKTTLVDTFVDWAAAGAVWISRGQCIEQYGAGEPYLPLLEALGRLGKGSDGTQVVELLHQHAPSWLLQLPSLVSDEEIDTLQRRASGATQERMLRELAEAIDFLTAERALILVLEDLHWSDRSTLDWLAYVARRRDPARLLVVGTYRPVEAIVQAHPVRATTEDLQRQGQGTELALGYLPTTAIVAYLGQRFGATPKQRALAQVLYQQTTGNPLFMVTMVDALVQQGILQQGADEYELTCDLNAVELSVPPGLQQLIVQQLERLSAAERELLEAASVVGREFAIDAVTACLDVDSERLEAQCMALARHGQFVRAGGMEEWPDGTLSAQFVFIHDLYRQITYEQIPQSLRVRWHRQIGARLEAGYSRRAHELGAELAEHFRRGRDTKRAIEYYHHAGENAQRRSAHHEAIGHFNKGLELLTTLPDTPERTEQELTLLLALGPALNVTRGDASLEVEQTYVRAQALCQQQDGSPQALRVMRGLWSVYHGRLQFRQARDLGEQYLALGQREQDSGALVEAHYALGTSLFYLGEFAAARWHFEQGLAHYNLQPERFWGARAEDPGVACLAFLVSTLGFLGYPDQARQRADEALHLARELAHPYSLAFAQYRAGLNALFCRQVSAAQALAEAVLSVATTHGFPFYEALGMALKGGTFVRQGKGEEGGTLLRQGLSGLSRAGTQPAPHWLIWQAELCGYAGQAAEGLAFLEEAVTQVATTGNAHAVAELHRLQGEFILALSAERAAEAEACFQEALAVACRQEAKILELRAAMSLSRLWQQQGGHDRARHLLGEVYGWFTEGFDVPDLQEAVALLEALGSPARSSRG